MEKRRNPLDRYARDLPPGELTWIGVRPKRREPLESVSSTRAVATLGLEGDHRMVVRCLSFPKSSLRRRRTSWGATLLTQDSYAETLW